MIPVKSNRFFSSTRLFLVNPGIPQERNQSFIQRDAGDEPKAAEVLLPPVPYRGMGSDVHNNSVSSLEEGRLDSGHLQQECSLARFQGTTRTTVHQTDMQESHREWKESNGSVLRMHKDAGSIPVP
mmetsp:Transcript_4911/g.14198  ORF Transcript_4911/g.14198 Transcript_4911/m.14198 type:complete len:126 (-) Transcript_4911:657-1034(-)